MAQLGDFKIRYGVVLTKEKPVGILFDIEYLPVSKLSVNFKLIFQSVCQMMNLPNINLITPEPDPEKEYSFTILGQDYLKLIKENDLMV